MEQAQYWMLMKKRQFLKSQFQVSLSENNWEERAFAEDAGWIWPPRSYTCSFCRREFRSAQALGGHMNVHRRDRAKLKQSGGGSPNNENFPHQNQNPIPIKSFGPDSTAKRSLNNVITGSYDEDGGIDRKRRKIGVCSTLPFVVVGVGGSMEELDLELRLGVQPKVK